MRSGRERGAATLLVLAMAGVLVTLGAALAVVVAMVAAHRAAQSAADLAALAGANAVLEGRQGCAAAGETAAANGATLTGCLVSGADVAVEVRVAGPHWLGQTADLGARSRAGPAP
ncbi:MAG TPA: Rv3654c family TadE-like protein [Nocardioides sp.]|nr:Rv3654c family TadE-like protein [Nocardioides sp.]